MRLNQPVVSLGLILGLAAVLRVIFLGRDSFWVDEAASVAFARVGWQAFVDFFMRYEANMALYYALLHLWLSLGDSEVTIRALSVIPAVATIPVMYALGARLFAPRVGLLGALILALNAFHVNHAQEARSYPLLLFFVTLASLMFVKAIEHPSRRNWIGYTLAIVLAVYSHLFGALVLIGHWASLGFRLRRIPWRPLIWSTLAIGLLLLPIGLTLLTRGAYQLGWYTREPGALSIVRVLYILAGGVFTLPAYGLASLLAVVDAVKTWRASWNSRQAWSYGFVHAWLVGPIAVTFAFSFITPLFISRYLIVVLPALVLLVVAGILQIRPARALGAALIVLVALSAASLRTYYAKPEVENWRGATRYVQAEARSGDAIMFYAAHIRPAYEYYRDRLRDTPGVPTVVFPADRAGWGVLEAGFERAPLRDLLEETASRYPRVWLVLSHDRIAGLGRDIRSRALQEFLAGRYGGVTERRFTGIRVLLYSRAP